MVRFYWRQAFVDANTYREAIMLLSLIWAHLHFQSYSSCKAIWAFRGSQLSYHWREIDQKFFLSVLCGNLVGREK